VNYYPHLLFIKSSRPFLSFLQYSLYQLPILPLNNPHAKIPRNSHQRTLDRIVIHIIRVRRMRLTSLDLIQTEKPEQGCVDEFTGNQGAGTGARACAEGKMRRVCCFVGGSVRGG